MAYLNELKRLFCRQTVENSSIHYFSLYEIVYYQLAGTILISLESIFLEALKNHIVNLQQENDRLK